MTDPNTIRPLIRFGRLTTEGDTLHYEARGNGPPLLLIPGGGGDGGSYSFIANILANEFKVITYDRRANARSTMNDPNNFDIGQQSRDAVAIIHAAGETSALIFGNSSGAVIALDIATMNPQAARAIVAHEPPLARVHPSSDKWQHFFKSVYDTSLRFGNIVAMMKFIAFGIGLDFSFRGAFKAARAARLARQKSAGRYLALKAVIDFFIKQELLPVTNYVPDIELLKKNKESIFMAAGERSLQKKRFYAETALILAEQIGCELVVFPGHHGSFVDMPAEWASTLRSVARKALASA